MERGYILIAVLMLLYLVASFLGSGDIGILYVVAVGSHAISGGKVPFQGAYDAALAVYIIIMLVFFIIGGKKE